MNRAQRRAIEDPLPQKYRGHAGYTRLLGDLSLRVSVSGIRGKTALTAMTMDALMSRGLSVYAKQTGTDPRSLKDGIVHPIDRDPRRKTVLDETEWEVKRHWPMDAVVLENQGITPYTMLTFNKLLCRPNYVLLTNIRRDHQGDIARRLPLMAKYFVRSAPRGCTVISGERDRRLRNVMRAEAKRVGVRFLDAAPGPMVVPGFESVTILDRLLSDWMGEGLTADEKRGHLERLEAIFRWHDSALPGVRWFDGGEINDVDSTRVVLEYMLHREPLPVTLVAYFRRDRPDRTASFVPFLRSCINDGLAERVVVCGHRSKAVAARLGHPSRVLRLPDRPETVGDTVEAIRRLDRTPQAVMTVANAVPPWPRALADALRTGHLPRAHRDLRDEELRLAAQAPIPIPARPDRRAPKGAQAGPGPPAG